MTVQRYHSWDSEDDDDGHYVAYDGYVLAGQVALSEVAEHFDRLPDAGNEEWDAVKVSCMNKLREIFE